MRLAYTSLHLKYNKHETIALILRILARLFGKINYKINNFKVW